VVGVRGAVLVEHVGGDQLDDEGQGLEWRMLLPAAVRGGVRWCDAPAGRPVVWG
jgi:hypothetical protein